MVDLWYCLDLVVSEGMSQVSRRLEVGDHKRRTLNTRLSSGTSAGIFAWLAGPYRLLGQSMYEKRTKLVFCTRSKKGSENRSSLFEPEISRISFLRGSGPPLRWIRSIQTNNRRLLFVCLFGCRIPFNHWTSFPNRLVSLSVYSSLQQIWPYHPARCISWPGWSLSVCSSARR